MISLCASSEMTLTGPRGAQQLQNKFKDDVVLAVSVAMAVALVVLVTCDTLIFNRNNTRLQSVR